MSTAINDDAYRFAPAISLHDPPLEESEVVFGAAQRHLSADRQDSSDVPVMSESIAQRRRETVQRCTEEAKRLRRKLMFGMTTSLALQSVPLPADCDLELDVLHTVSSTKAKRVRVQNSPLRSHVWKPVANVEPVRINQHVFALDLFHTWAQLAVHVSLPRWWLSGMRLLRRWRANPSWRRDAMLRVSVAICSDSPMNSATAMGKARACRRRLFLCRTSIRRRKRNAVYCCNATACLVLLCSMRCLM